MNNEHIYDDNSISSLKGADRVRLRPGIMFGSNNLQGAFCTVNEILANSLDEVRAGWGNEVEVHLLPNGAIGIQDFGRGVPMDWNEKEGRYNWELIYAELYAGGKYDDDDYLFSIGLNGVGAAAVQYTSSYMKVISKRADFIYEKHFEKGESVGDLIKTPNLNHEKTGTYVEWKIDNDVFPDTNFPISMFKTFCETQACLNHIKITLFDDIHGTEFEYAGLSLEDFFKSQLPLSEDSEIVDILSASCNSSGSEHGKKYNAKCDVFVAITKNVPRKVIAFHNTALMTLGVHVEAVEDVLRQFFQTHCNQDGVRVRVGDYVDCISVFVNSYSTSNSVSYANQTKNGVTNAYIYGLIAKTLQSVLEDGYAKDLGSVKNLCDTVYKIADERIRSKELEKYAKKAKEKVKSKRVEKRVDCRSKNAEECELYIVEGDSALASCKEARDMRTQAILPIRGKVLNCLKASREELAKSIEKGIVGDIVATVGTGLDLGDGLMQFNMKNLRYNKIIFCTDADVDGFQIRVLLFSLFYRLMPRLLEEGHVYIVESPLFEIVTNRGSRFAYSPEEKNAIVKELEGHGERVVSINRSKGLGENDPEMMKLTTMDATTRRLIQIKASPKDMVLHEVVNALFGVDTNKQRKKFIRQAVGVGIDELEEEAESLAEAYLSDMDNELLFEDVDSEE